jgi:hypothetical protein
MLTGRIHMIARSVGAATAGVALCLAAANAASAAPHAVVRPAPADRQQYCTPPAKRMLIVVVDGGKDLTHVEYCALDGHMSAQLFVDHRGKSYVVARTGEDSEGRADAEYVRILELSHDRDAKDARDFYDLGDVAALALPPAVGGTAPTYHVVDTNTGGLELVLDYPPVPPRPYALPPLKQISIHLGP